MEQLDLAKIFKALSNEKRLMLFKNLYEWGKCDIKDEQTFDCCSGIKKAFTKACSCTDLSRSTISHHFKELQNAGLITSLRDGQTISLKVNEEAVQLIKKFLE